jgi:hypothetical protein
LKYVSIVIAYLDPTILLVICQVKSGHFRGIVKKPPGKMNKNLEAMGCGAQIERI